MSNQMQRGKMQVMYSFPPGSTFSNPKHDLIEKADKLYGDQLSIASEQELIDAVHARLNDWDGGIQGSLPAPANDRWAIVDPGSVYATIFPLVFECKQCERVHDYSEAEWKLEQNGLVCQRDDCDGVLRQIHHVGVCPSCSNIKSISVPSCDQHGNLWIQLDDRSDRYQDFKWRCGACGGAVVDEEFHTFCDCGQMMQTTVHSSSKALNVHDITRVDLSGENIYQKNLYDPNDIDPLIVGAYLQEFDHPETTVEGLLRQGSADELDLDELDLSSQEEIEAAKKVLGAVGADDDPDQVRLAVQERVGDVDPSDNMRRYVQLQEKMSQTSAREDATNRECELMDQMGILDLGTTSEFPLLNAVYGYHRTFEDQEDSGATPAVRTFPPVEVEDGDWRTPIFTARSETEAVIVQLDPRSIGHWLATAGYNIQDTEGMELRDARAEIYRVMDPVEPYATDIEDGPQYNPVTRAVHRLLHTVSHLLLQRAAVHSGIEEASFAEYLFTEGLAVAIYSNNTQDYTAGGLFTLVDRNLEDWLLSTLRQGERCVYDSTCANIRGGACHACLHISEIGCQHFNQNLSRIDLYGDRVGKDAPPGFWKLTGGLG